MLSVIRKRITYANVAATLALLFAMSGGAYAAKRYLVTSTGQVSPKVLRALKGAPGAKGATGATGPAGPSGAAGAQGPAGPVGTVGPSGEPGAEGKEGKAGAPGAKGQTGSPWTAGGTLPSRATETGTWSLGILPAGTLEAPIYVPISFAIPLDEGLDGSHVHYVKMQETAPAACAGGTASQPSAAPGNLCVYEAQNLFLAFLAIHKADSSEQAGASTAGALLLMSGEKESSGWGTWAVTAE